jgi:hypothetical protein
MQMIHAPERVEAIRSRATSGIQSISALLANISNAGSHSDAFTKGRLRQLSYLFGDVQTFFLGGLLRESRTLEAESVWLSHAEMVLQIADQQLTVLVENIHSKYEMNVKSVGR